MAESGIIWEDISQKSTPEEKWEMYGTLCEEYLESRCRELSKTEKGTMGRNTMPKFKDKKV